MHTFWLPVLTSDLPYVVWCWFYLLWRASEDTSHWRLNEWGCLLVDFQPQKLWRKRILFLILYPFPGFCSDSGKGDWEKYLVVPPVRLLLPCTGSYSQHSQLPRSPLTPTTSPTVSPLSEKKTLTNSTKVMHPWSPWWCSISLPDLIIHIKRSDCSDDKSHDLWKRTKSQRRTIW